MVHEVEQPRRATATGTGASSFGLVWRAVAAALVSLLLLPYAVVPVYARGKSRPFVGARLYNPYADRSGRWLQANFHAHSRAWLGTTNGHESVDAVRDAYVSRGYDVAGISNYQTIARSSSRGAAVPIYEHGYNIGKTHQLALGAAEVDWFDVPIWQSSDAKQYVLSRLARSGELTAIVHPYMRAGYSLSDMEWLGGFELLEVRSHWDTATAWWDSALTAGNAVWGIGSDDSHGVANADNVGRVWTMVRAASASQVDVEQSLRAGDMYVVAGVRGRSDIALADLSVAGDSIRVKFEAPVDQIAAIADGGATKTSVTNSAELLYLMTPADHYIRIVAQTRTSTVYLNPVIRADGTPVARDVPAQRFAYGFGMHLVIAGLWATAMLALVRGTRLTRGRLGRVHAAKQGPTTGRVR